MLAPADASERSVRAVLFPPADFGRELAGGLDSRGLLPRGLALALRALLGTSEPAPPPSFGVDLDRGDREPDLGRGLLRGPGSRIVPAREMRGTGGGPLALPTSFSTGAGFLPLPPRDMGAVQSG